MTKKRKKVVRRSAKHSHALPRGDIVEDHFRVAIYGSARIKRGDPRYKMVHELARKIAAHNMDVVTGGGPGLMDAASRGHHAGRKNNDVHSVGLTIHLPREQREGYHLDIKREFWKFSERLDNFMKWSDVVVVAPGGVGTLLELVFSWQLVQVGHVKRIPIILLGKMWPDLVKWVRKHPMKEKFLNPEDVEMLYLARDVDDAFTLIEETHQKFLLGKNSCLPEK